VVVDRVDRELAEPRRLRVIPPVVRNLATRILRTVTSDCRAATGLAHAATDRAIDAARERVLPLLESAPWPERLNALQELDALTRRTFGCLDSGACACR
jgi:hypothetical protein